MYSAVPCGPPISTRMTNSDVAKMIDTNTARRLMPHERPRGWVKVFCVPEWHKVPPRLRRVAHPELVNAHLGRATLRPLHVGSRLHVRQAAFDGTHVCALDAASFFDQFPLDPAVSLHFCFRGQDGATYCLTALPMGQRHSTEVATQDRPHWPRPPDAQGFQRQPRLQWSHPPPAPPVSPSLLAVRARRGLSESFRSPLAWSDSGVTGDGVG